MKSDVSNSRLMIANPTHIAIGIYFKPHLSPIPLISVRETNEVALAVRKYAKEIGWICPYISRHLLSLNPLLA
ncbi:EscU/YscU/HrcU family type III secretion system export apparatus switch protein, partial [Escherichia coli]|nr:EscU/YscU/HrcU family type III secretion system export apparatus switch protein [Escherichia coli]